MPKVTYTGPMPGFTHHGNRTCTDYVFQRGIPTEVSQEDAEHYRQRQEMGDEWIVDFGPVERAKRAVEAVKEAVSPEEEEPEDKKARKNGKDKKFYQRGKEV